MQRDGPLQIEFKVSVISNGSHDHLPSALQTSHGAPPKNGGILTSSLAEGIVDLSNQAELFSRSPHISHRHTECQFIHSAGHQEALQETSESKLEPCALCCKVP